MRTQRTRTRDKLLKSEKTTLKLSLELLKQKWQRPPRNLTSVWEKHQSQLESLAHRVEDGLSAFATIVSNGNRDLGEYIGIMDKAQTALYGGASNSPASQGGTSISRSAQSEQGQGKSSGSGLKTGLGNTLRIISGTDVSSVLITVAGQSYSYPNNKSGIAKAYRTALKSGDAELIAKTNELFISGSVPAISQPQNMPKLYELPGDARIIHPRDVDMSTALGMDDPNFWNHHGRTKQDYLDLAGKLPEVQNRLDQGESLDTLLKDSELGATANQFYHPDHMIKLEKTSDGALEFGDDGRHRIAAAKELGYSFPAVIRHPTGVAVGNSPELKHEDVPDWGRSSLRPSEEATLRDMVNNGEIDVPIVDSKYSDPKRAKKHLPEDTGLFLGSRGNSGFIPNDRLALDQMQKFGQNHVNYNNGYPDFSPFTKIDTPWGPLNCQVEIGHMTDQRQNPSWEYGRRPAGAGHDPNYDLGNFAQADNALLEKLRKINPYATLEDVSALIDLNNLTWHECSDGKTMQLVPTVIHNACRHSGGVSEMKYRMAMGDIELSD